MHPSKVHRYLVSLVRVGLASQSSETGHYDLGSASRSLGLEALRRTEAVGIVSPHAVTLRDVSGHTVNLAVWTEAGPTIVRTNVGTHSLPIVPRVGSTLPLLDSAIGLVFYAFLPRGVTSAILKQQQREKATTTMSQAEADELAELVRGDGIGRTQRDLIFGVSAAAAPVFGADDSLEAVMAVILARRRATTRENARVAELLRTAAARASHELGCPV
jgi:DNA-binding IclR family transcriptional regulator